MGFNGILNIPDTIPNYSDFGDQMTSTCKGLKNLALSVAICLAGAPTVVNSAPELNQANVIDGGDFENGSIVSVQGRDFGAKENAAPVLHDLVSHAYENGRTNKIHSLLSSSDEVPTDSLDGLSPVWSATASAFYKAPDSKRHSDSDFVYHLEGNNAWLGRPVAYGGDDGWATPTDNAKTYVAWWLRTAYDPAAYWRVSPNEQTGTFEPGEKIALGDEISGQFIGSDSDGLLNVILNDFGSIHNLKGRKIVGLTSGSTTIFPEESRKGSGYGFESPGSQKYLRVWEDPSGKEGYRFSWTQMHQTGFNVDGGPHWVGTPLEGGEWHLMEFEIDTDERQVRTAVNGKWHPPLNFEEGVVIDGKLSPTIALIGLNGKTGMLQDTEIDEIYMDSSLNRIMLGNSQVYDEVTHLELQRPLEWSGNELEFEIRLGALNKSSGIYLYVFNESGVPNQLGYKLVEGKSPPKKVNLDIR